MEKLSLNQESTWHVLYTRHQCERRVEQRLIQKGFETFLPLYHTTHRWKDRMKPLDLPLFPSYVFIRGGVDRRLDLITTSDVAFIVGDSSGPGTIAAEEIDAIRLLVSTRLNVEPHPFLEVGDRVRVTDGPLEGLEGILVRKKNQYRLVVSVQILQRSVAVEVTAYMLERVSSTRQLRAALPLHGRASSLLPATA